MSGFNLAAYVLNVYSPKTAPAEEGSAYRWGEEDARLLERLPALMREIEENLEDLLPKGYHILVRPWDQGEESDE